MTRQRLGNCLRMLIDIIKDPACCVVKFKQGKLKFTDDCSDLCLPPGYGDMVKTAREENCLPTQVPQNKLFFFKLYNFSHPYGRTVWECECFGSHDGETLNIARQLSNTSRIPHDTLWVTTYSPSDFFFIDGDECSILTSDGVVLLQEDMYITQKGGKITEISTEDMLTHLGRQTTQKSVISKELRLEPLKTRPSKVRKGTIIYNAIKNKLEFWDGDSWSEL